MAASNVWRFLPYAQKTVDKRKITRRRAELQLRLDGFFPPQGHILVEMSRTQRGTEEEEEDIKLLALGGARHKEEATWQMASDLMVIELLNSKADVLLLDVYKADVTGASISHLSSPGGVISDNVLYLFGGLDTSTMATTNELVCLTFKSRKSFDCTIFKDPSTSSLHNDFKQHGVSPPSRTGHTLTKVNEDYALLFGGLQLDKRFVPELVQRFSQVCNDGSFYLLELKNKSWKKLTLPKVTSRAYHQSTFLKRLNTMFILGGVVYEGRKPVERVSLASCIMLKISTDLTNMTLTEVNLTGVPSHVSMHSTCVVDNNILIHGGFHQDIMQIDLSLTPKPVGNTYMFNPDTSKYTLLCAPEHVAIATAGHSAYTVDGNCV